MTKNMEGPTQSAWIDRRDVVGLIGIGLIGYGAWMIYPAAGFLAPGAILTGIAIFGVRG